VAVERFQRRLQFDRKVLGIQRLGLAAAFLRHLGADVLPEIAELGHFLVGQVVGHRYARQFDDAALDGIHQREIAHGPRKQRALDVTGTAQEERGGREIHHPGQTELATDRFQTVDPQPRGFAVFLRLLAVVAGELAFLVAVGLFTIAVVRLVVDGHDVFHAHQRLHHALQHLALGFQCLQFGTGPSLEQLAAALRKLHALAQLECVVVGDDDTSLVQVLKHVAGDQLTAAVVTVRVIGLKDLQAVLDGDAGRDD